MKHAVELIRYKSKDSEVGSCLDFLLLSFYVAGSYTGLFYE
jgi:hypothetical protein